jgi:hypothetical protein
MLKPDEIVTEVTMTRELIQKARSRHPNIMDELTQIQKSITRVVARFSFHCLESADYLLIKEKVSSGLLDDRLIVLVRNYKAIAHPALFPEALKASILSFQENLTKLEMAVSDNNRVTALELLGEIERIRQGISDNLTLWFAQ